MESTEKGGGDEYEWDAEKSQVETEMREAAMGEDAEEEHEKERADGTKPFGKLRASGGRHDLLRCRSKKKGQAAPSFFFHLLLSCATISDTLLDVEVAAGGEGHAVGDFLAAGGTFVVDLDVTLAALADLALRRNAVDHVFHAGDTVAHDF